MNAAQNGVSVQNGPSHIDQILNQYPEDPHGAHITEFKNLDGVKSMGVSARDFQDAARDYYISRKDAVKMMVDLGNAQGGVTVNAQDRAAALKTAKQYGYGNDENAIAGLERFEAAVRTGRDLGSRLTPSHSPVDPGATQREINANKCDPIEGTVTAQARNGKPHPLEGWVMKQTLPGSCVSPLLSDNVSVPTSMLNFRP